MYQTTIRVKRKEDIELLKRVKKEFFDTSLSKAIIRLAYQYYKMKDRENKLKESITKKYEIPTEIIEEIYY